MLRTLWSGIIVETALYALHMNMICISLDISSFLEFVASNQPNMNNVFLDLFFCRRFVRIIIVKAYCSAELY